MKTLYFDCGMGAAGDMLMASLYEICPDKEKFLKTMNEMGLPGLSIEAEPSVKCGITGTHMKVTIHGEEEESVDVDLQGHEHEHHQEHNHEDSQHSHAHDHHHDHEDTHHDHSHESHHHAHEMAESAAEQTVHECIYDKQADHNHENQNDLNHPHTHDHDHNCGHDHTHDHGHPHHHHASMAGISHIIEHLNLPEEVKNDIVGSLPPDRRGRVPRPRKERRGDPLSRGGHRRRDRGYRWSLPFNAHDRPAEGDRIPDPCRKRKCPLRPRDPAGTGTCDSIYFTGTPNLQRRYQR